MFLGVENITTIVGIGCRNTGLGMYHRIPGRCRDTCVAQPQQPQGLATLFNFLFSLTYGVNAAPLQASNRGSSADEVMG